MSVIKPRVYSLGNKACRLVDKTFDKLHCFGHLKFTFKYIPFSFSMFVVRKTDAEGKKKSRAVIDIRKLNEMMLPDS